MGKATSVQVVQVGEALTGRPKQPRNPARWSLRVAPTHPGRAPAPPPTPLGLRQLCASPCGSDIFLL